MDKTYPTATPKQIRFLEGKGFRNVETWHQEAAKQMIDEIVLNGWKVPFGIVPEEYSPQPAAKELQFDYKRATASMLEQITDSKQLLRIFTFVRFIFLLAK